jgi:hypothetical protein
MLDFWPFRRDGEQFFPDSAFCFLKLSIILFQPGRIYFGLGDETYANGDGTDSYCNSNLPITNTSLYYSNAYEEPVCDKASCSVYFFDSLASQKPGIYFFTGDKCIPENPIATADRYFVCL